MRKRKAPAVVALLLIGCAASTIARGAENTISFTEINSAGQQVRQLSFLLTSERAKTCIAGNWKKAKAIRDAHAYTYDPAYTMRTDHIEVLLVNEACDVYDSYIGALSGGKFVGEHTEYGLGYDKTIGKVSGTYSVGKP